MTRVAVVTGGASGIGQAIARRLAREGHAVAVLDVNADGAQETAKELRADGAQALARGVDVSDRAQVDEAIAAARRELGPVSILVTSAAVALQCPFGDLTLEAWNRILAINLTGTFNCVQSVLPDMLEAGWGRVVLISSSSAQRGAPGMAHYAASKGGVIALSKTLALEYATTGVTVNNIAPSAVDTPSVQRKLDAGTLPPREQMAKAVPVGRLGTGDDIAAAVAYLTSDEASYVIGQTVGVNGGAFVGW
jgi:2-hydroxycyclohexanecarboxyl-CoA dehydrogenase